MRKLSCIGSLVAVLVAGCGGDDGGGINEGPSVGAGTANMQAMKEGVKTAADLQTALSAGSGEAVAGGALSLSSLGMSAATKSGGGGGFGLTVAQALSTINAETGTTGTKECTASGCTFKDYGSGGFTLTGSLTVSDAGAGAKSVVWNITGSGDSDALGGGSSAFGDDFKFTWNWKGDLTVSPTSLMGAAGGSGKGSGSAQGQSFSFEYGSFVKFNGVTMDTSGCPTGGSMTAKWWITAKSGSQTQTDGAQATQTFSGC